MKFITKLRNKIHRAFSNRKFLYEQYLPFRDSISSIRHPRLIALHRQLRARLEERKRNWENEYCDGYFYQGYERIGISGVKPTEQRLQNYSTGTAS